MYYIASYCVQNTVYSLLVQNTLWYKLHGLLVQNYSLQFYDIFYIKRNIQESLKKTLYFVKYNVKTSKVLDINNIYIYLFTYYMTIINKDPILRIGFFSLQNYIFKIQTNPNPKQYFNRLKTYYLINYSKVNPVSLEIFSSTFSFPIQNPLKKKRKRSNLKHAFQKKCTKEKLQKNLHVTFKYDLDQKAEILPKNW